MFSSVKRWLDKPFQRLHTRIDRIDSALDEGGRRDGELTQLVQDRTAQLEQRIEARLSKISALMDALQLESRSRHPNGGRLANADLEQRGTAYRLGLHAVGVLNYANDYISGERTFLQRFITAFPEPLIFDVGANEGQYSSLVRELVPASRVHAFEPHPTSYAKLAEAARPLGFEAHQLALSDTTGSIDIFDYVDESGSQHASVYRDVIEGIHRRAAAPSIVPRTTVDSIAAELGIERINLLKIDTEGHELSVLLGSQALREAGRIDVIQFEFNEMNVVSRVFFKDFFELLSNYRIYRLLQESVIEFETYDATFMEVFAYQNIACIRRDLNPSWIHG